VIARYYAFAFYMLLLDLRSMFIIDHSIAN
jgi:hypothetical protein